MYTHAFFSLLLGGDILERRTFIISVTCSSALFKVIQRLTTSTENENYFHKICKSITEVHIITH